MEGFLEHSGTVEEEPGVQETVVNSFANHGVSVKMGESEREKNRKANIPEQECVH